MNIHQLLDQLSENFKSFPPSSTKSTMLYDSVKLQRILLGKEAAGVFSDKEHVNKLDTISGKFGSLTSVMHKNPEEGYAEYKLFEQADLHQLEEYDYLYVKQWVLSVEALYYYKIKDFKRAFNLTLECISLCDMMISMGMTTLVLRLIEQNKNLARIYLAGGNLQKSWKFEFEILNYLFNGEQTMLFGMTIREPRIWTSIEYIREGYAYEYVRGLIHSIVNSKQNENDKAAMFYEIFNDLTFVVNTPDRKIIRDWLNLFASYYAEDYLAFLTELTELLQAETTLIYDILKILALIQVKTIIEKSNYLLSEELYSEINHYSETAITAYDYLKPLIYKPEKTAKSHGNQSGILFPESA
ncbi:hypothetical protein AAFN85_19040 [Mucilaginibacter sp. CAU 1740]|uniref:hypothetical protein n=1 Tax=Mucilaginibacter sp. CAU 1740 TaxID=3140365 RepID=UPI00325C03B1